MESTFGYTTAVTQVTARKLASCMMNAGATVEHHCGVMDGGVNNK